MAQLTNEDRRIAAQELVQQAACGNGGAGARRPRVGERA